MLLLRYAKDMEGDIKREVSEKDFDFLGKLSKEKKINSNVLKRLLDADSQTGYSYIPQLPLELALVDIIGQEIEK